MNANWEITHKGTHIEIDVTAYDTKRHLFYNSGQRIILPNNFWGNKLSVEEIVNNLKEADTNPIRMKKVSFFKKLLALIVNL